MGNKRDDVSIRKYKAFTEIMPAWKHTVGIFITNFHEVTSVLENPSGKCIVNIKCDDVSVGKHVAFTEILRTEPKQWYLLLVSRVQREPQGHRTPLALGDGSDAVRVFSPGAKPDHAAALRTHRSLQRTKQLRTEMCNVRQCNILKEYLKTFTVTVLASNSVKMKSPPSKSSLR